MPDKPELGQIAYNAYRESLIDIGFSGYPKWDEMSPDNQQAWQLAAKAVITYTSQ
jgi:hypothetical protein